MTQDSFFFLEVKTRWLPYCTHTVQTKIFLIALSQNNSPQVTTLEVRYSFVDQLSILGEQHALWPDIGALGHS